MYDNSNFSEWTWNLVDAKVSEEAKIQAMMHQSTYQYQPQRVYGMSQEEYIKKYKWSYQWNYNPSQASELPPDGYFCHRCGSPEHFIKNCPMKKDPNFQRVKRSLGIPKTFLTPVDNGNILGAMMRPDGSFAVNTKDA